MHLRLLLPYRVLADEDDVIRIVAETGAGSLGLLEHRLDCVAAIVPGILTWETKAKGEVFVAVDAGMLVKIGPDVLVSVRRATAGNDLARLRDTVEREFLALDAHEQDVRKVMAKLESGLIRRLAVPPGG